jgi:hypothetical protein
MKPLLLALCALFAFSGLSAQTPFWQPSPGHTQVPIWPGAVPDPQLVAGPEVCDWLTPKGITEGAVKPRRSGRGYKAAKAASPVHRCSV